MSAANASLTDAPRAPQLDAAASYPIALLSAMRKKAAERGFMTAEEIEDEIAAYRGEKRGR
ncbi:MAG: hypothetical protein LBR38_04050 [Synergistaceae bacterium]|nr:hypothetical protein [Synergistaceae bacterium]